MSSDVEAAVHAKLGEEVTASSPIGGDAFRVRTTNRTLVAKRGSGHSAAAAGLRWLAEYGDVPAPEVFGQTGDWLFTEYVAAGEPSPSAAEEFGRGLATQHLRGADAFGCAPPGGPADAWMGRAPMRNEPTADWPSFYAVHRIEPYVRTLVDQGQCPPGRAKVFDEVCTRLPELAGEPEPPARLHGDAWSGNVHWAADGRAWLIDPAAYGGHRETDLAMLRLFGLPMLDRVLGAYAEAAEDAGSPLRAGWRKRVPLHQLFPLLVHAVLFGGGYLGQAVSAARQALG